MAATAGFNPRSESAIDFKEALGDNYELNSNLKTPLALFLKNVY